MNLEYAALIAHTLRRTVFCAVFSLFYKCSVVRCKDVELETLRTQVGLVQTLCNRLLKLKTTWLETEADGT